MPTIGQVIKHRREAKGWDQPALARKAGVGQSTISKLECNVHDPGVMRLVRICQALDCSVVEVLTEANAGLVPRSDDAVERAMLSLVRQLPEEEQAELRRIVEITVIGMQRRRQLGSASDEDPQHRRPAGFDEGLAGVVAA